MDKKLEEALDRISQAKTEQIQDVVDLEIKNYWSDAVNKSEGKLKTLKRRIALMICREQHDSNSD